MNPLISVITVVFNDIEGLRKTALSLVEQTLSDVEHVVIDGASRDDCRRWPELADPSVPLVFVSEPDGGIYDAMNKGIAASTGRILLFLNAGDCLKDPQVLTFVAADFTTHSWRWAYGGVDRWNGSTFFKKADKRPFDLDAFVAGRFWVPHQAAFFTRGLLDEVGPYDVSMGVGADQELMIRCGMASRPTTWARTIADFDNGGVSTRMSFWDHEFEWYRIRRKLLTRSRSADLLDYVRTLRHVVNIVARRSVKAALVWARDHGQPGRLGRGDRT